MTTIRQIAETFGLPMIDADAAIDVTITKADIQGAVANNQTCCAIARALKRKPGVKEAYVFRSVVWIEQDEHLVRYGLPPSLQKEIVSFDRSGDFRPGHYGLSASPNPKRNRAQRAGKKPQAAYRKARKRRGYVAKRRPHRSEGVRGTGLD